MGRKAIIMGDCTLEAFVKSHRNNKDTAKAFNDNTLIWDSSFNRMHSTCDVCNANFVTTINNRLMEDYYSECPHCKAKDKGFRVFTVNSN